MTIRTVIQRGPKSKKSVAFAIDWPGWSRGATSVDGAIERLEAYRDRYAQIASLAGLEAEFNASGALEVVGDDVGTGSVDFWGISFSASSFEQGPMSEAERERKIALLQAAWHYFDGVAARVSPEMQKGPRGGGRDRDEIVAHVLRNEQGDFARKVGVASPEEVMLGPDEVRRHHENFVAAIRDHNARGATAGRSWTVPFLIRHTAFHALDHAWEMEDKDLS